MLLVLHRSCVIYHSYANIIIMLYSCMPSSRLSAPPACLTAAQSTPRSTVHPERREPLPSLTMHHHTCRTCSISGICLHTVLTCSSTESNVTKVYNIIQGTYSVVETCLWRDETYILRCKCETHLARGLPSPIYRLRLLERSARSWGD